MAGLRATGTLGLPTPRTGAYTLAVASEDATLAARATALLEHEGLQIRLEAGGPGLETLDEVERRPTLVIVRCPHDRRTLDRVLRHCERHVAGAIVIRVIAADDRPDVSLTLARGADVLVRE